jgi:branched-chain amino acid transport system substrate-binding protein
LAGTIDLTNAGDYVFRIYPSSEVGSRYIAKVAVDRFKAKRVAVLYPTSPPGLTSKQFVWEVLKEAGVEVAAIETFKDGDRDFRTQLTKIIESKPDLLICSAYYEDGAQILVQAKQLGLNMPILGEDGWFGPIAAIAGDCLKNLYFGNVAFGPEFTDNKMMQDFVTAFKGRFSKAPNSYAAAGHAAVYTVKAAIESGGYEGKRIKEALYSLDLPSSLGTVKFDENGANVGAKYGLFQLSANNEPVVVK